MAISRSREYEADASGASFAGQPYGLANALEKLGTYSKKIPMHTDHPNTAHMFIVNPLRGKSMMSLFSTHPPLKERIARLRGVRSSFDIRHPDGDNGRRQAEAAWRNLSRWWVDLASLQSHTIANMVGEIKAILLIFRKMTSYEGPNPFISNAYGFLPSPEWQDAMLFDFLRNHQLWTSNHKTLLTAS